MKGKSLTNNLPTADYPKGRKPVLPVNREAPVVRPVAGKSAFGKNVLPTNSVSDADSARLQKANLLPGRLGSKMGKHFAN